MPNEREEPKKEQQKEHPDRDYFNKPQEKTQSDQSGAGQAGVSLYSSWSGGRSR
jgi:hypothetical protein